MKTRTSHQPTKSGQFGRSMSGFAMVEVLLVVGLILIVCALALKSIAVQHCNSQQYQIEMSTLQAEQAADWTLVSVEGQRVWLRGN